MPTGYTEDLMEKGQSFNDFVMGCARAFGALVMMRDDPMDAPIPEEFKPSDYYVKALSEAVKKLEMLKELSVQEREKFGEKEKEEDVRQYNDWLKRYGEENQRICDMEEKVQKWSPPTSDHNDLKKFMLEQLKISKNNETGISARLDECYQKSALNYYWDAVSNAKRDIKYHTEENEKEIERTESRNKWIKELRRSLV